MIWVEQSVELMPLVSGNELLKHIERCGRTCYKSEDKITDGSAERFVRGIIKRGHESVLEHGAITVRFVTDRSVTHEIVRHRLAAYSQESQRYVSYGTGDIAYIKQVGIESIEDEEERRDTQKCLERVCEQAEAHYQSLVKDGVQPQIARAVLPNATKTEIVMTADIREWRHFLRLRCDDAAHPQIRTLAKELLVKMYNYCPIICTGLEHFLPDSYQLV